MSKMKFMIIEENKLYPHSYRLGEEYSNIVCYIF